MVRQIHCEKSLAEKSWGRKVRSRLRLCWLFSKEWILSGFHYETPQHFEKKLLIAWQALEVKKPLTYYRQQEKSRLSMDNICWGNLREKLLIIWSFLRHFNTLTDTERKILMHSISFSVHGVSCLAMFFHDTRPIFRMAFKLLMMCFLKIS